MYKYDGQYYGNKKPKWRLARNQSVWIWILAPKQHKETTIKCMLTFANRHRFWNQNVTAQ